MTERNFVFRTEVVVHASQEAALRRAAEQRAVLDGAEDFDSSDLADCIQMLLDPGLHESGGMDIVYSAVEEVS